MLLFLPWWPPNSCAHYPRTGANLKNASWHHFIYLALWCFFCGRCSRVGMWYKSSRLVHTPVFSCTRPYHSSLCPCQNLNLPARHFPLPISIHMATLQFLHIRKVFPYTVFKGHFWMKLHFSYYFWIASSYQAYSSINQVMAFSSFHVSLHMQLPCALWGGSSTLPPDI